MLHHRAIIPVRLNGRAVPDKVIYNIQAFIILYVLIFLVSVGIIQSRWISLDLWCNGCRGSALIVT